MSETMLTSRAPGPANEGSPEAATLDPTTDSRSSRPLLNFKSWRKAYKRDTSSRGPASAGENYGTGYTSGSTLTAGRRSRPDPSTGSGESSSSRSPLHMNLGFLKNLTEKKATRVEGQAPKRRGPKPDSKPALTRRQELNRQAQRTHRERKELYIKALEQEVLRLKDNVSSALREKDSYAEENEVLKRLLQQNGITLPDSVAHQFGLARSGSSNDFGGSSTGSMAGSFGGSQGPARGIGPVHLRGGAPSSTGSEGSPKGRANHENNTNAHHNNNNGGGSTSAPAIQAQTTKGGVDYDQTGIDFVLTLERPCRDHMPYLLSRAQKSEGEICGHAFMVSCPPESHALQHPEAPYAPAAKEMHEQLGTLLDMSKRLDLDGEVTPVMAWGMIVDHGRVGEITEHDLAVLKNDLNAKVRCYGFGAVLEEFEVRDALSSIFATKVESYASFT